MTAGLSRRWATVAVLGAGTLFWGVGFIPAPAGPSQPAQPPAYTYGTGAAQAPANPLIIEPTTPAPTRGPAELDGEMAAKLGGYDNLANACQSGVEWVCDVHTVELPPAYMKQDTLRITLTKSVDGSDKDDLALALKFVAISPLPEPSCVQLDGPSKFYGAKACTWQLANTSTGADQ